LNQPWVGSKTINQFENLSRLEAYVDIRQGAATGENDKFVRQWHEVNFGNIFFSGASKEEVWDAKQKWVPYSKGGSSVKWYGNLRHILAFDKINYELLCNSGNRLPSRQYYFKQGVTWGQTGIGDASFRWLPPGFVFGHIGSALFSNYPNGNLETLSFLNSSVSSHFLSFISPTLGLEVGHIKSLPFKRSPACVELAQELVSLFKDLWDQSEISWDFDSLITFSSGAKAVADTYVALSLREYAKKIVALQKSASDKAAALESRNNDEWMDAFGLSEEIKRYPAKAYSYPISDFDYVCRSHLSYALGCMMGRYSLDRPGLILADSRDSQAEQLAAYEEKVGKHLGHVQFKPDADAIIPVLDGEWFEDDIVARTREFLEVTFPESTVTENLRFIEDSLGKDIRKYFCSDFYKDHLQTYKKRPIYWMVQSPKKGFACLIYLHRYTKDTLNQVLNNYFRPYLQKLEARLAQLGLDQLNDDLPTRERTAARKEAEKITKVLKECQAWEQDALLPLAQQRIELDLDDGVKVNYLKLQDVLAPIPGLAAKED
jgi:hypothetical protein